MVLYESGNPSLFAGIMMIIRLGLWKMKKERKKDRKKDETDKTKQMMI